MTGSTRRTRFSVRDAMAGVAIASAFACGTRFGPFSECLFIFVELIFPLYLATRLGGRASRFELMTILAADVFLIWGALLFFWPDPWPYLGVMGPFSTTGLRVNWLLLSAIYTIAFYVKGPGHPDVADPPAPRAPDLRFDALVLIWGALLFFWPWPWPYPWAYPNLPPGPFTTTGLRVGWLLLSAIYTIAFYVKGPGHPDVADPPAPRAPDLRFAAFVAVVGLAVVTTMWVGVLMSVNYRLLILLSLDVAIVASAIFPPRPPRPTAPRQRVRRSLLALMVLSLWFASIGARICLTTRRRSTGVVIQREVCSVPDRYFAAKARRSAPWLPGSTAWSTGPSR